MTLRAIQVQRSEAPQTNIGSRKEHVSESDTMVAIDPYFTPQTFFENFFSDGMLCHYRKWTLRNIKA